MADTTRKLVGQNYTTPDLVAKVTGKAKYSEDYRAEGMLYARLLRPPAHGATRTSLDTAKAKAMDGVTVVERDDLVAVLHANHDEAHEALSLIKAEWTKPAAAFDTESLADYFVKNGGDGDVKTTKGDVKSVTANVIESTFRTGYLAHAPMEPHTAAAEWKDGLGLAGSVSQMTRSKSARDRVVTRKGLRPVSSSYKMTPSE